MPQIPARGATEQRRGPQKCCIHQGAKRGREAVGCQADVSAQQRPFAAVNSSAVKRPRLAARHGYINITCAASSGLIRPNGITVPFMNSIPVILPPWSTVIRRNVSRNAFFCSLSGNEPKPTYR